MRDLIKHIVYMLMVLITVGTSMPVQAQSSPNSATDQETTLTFREPDAGPVVYAVQEILEEAYAALGITLRYVDMPRNRSLVEANNGRIAGELGRYGELDDAFQNLKRVPFPLFAFEIVLVADRRNCGLCGINDVENLAFISGMQTVMQLLHDNNFTRPTVQALDIQQLNLMFTNNRVNAVLMNDFEARQLGYYDNPHLIITPMLSLIGYHYLHDNYAHLIPKLNAELERMHAEGRVTTIYREHNVAFERMSLFEQTPFYPTVSVTAGLMRDRTHVDGSGSYWDLMKRVFEPVTDKLELHTNSYQRAVLGLNENRFDVLVGGTQTQSSIKGVASYTHFDYDRDVHAFTLTQQAMDELLTARLERPVCFVAGYEYDTFFEAGLTYYRANNTLDCFAMLDMKRVGAVITFNDNTPDWNTTPYVEHKLREAYPIRVMFHDTPRGRELRDWFDKRMRELVHSGEIRELFDETMLRRSYLYRSLPASSN